MPVEDRGNHKNRQDKKRENIQQIKYEMQQNQQNPRQVTAILWTPEPDEG